MPKTTIFFWKDAQSDPAPAGRFDMSQFPNAPASMALDPEARYVFATFREHEGASLGLRESTRDETISVVK